MLSSYWPSWVRIKVGSEKRCFILQLEPSLSHEMILPVQVAAPRLLEAWTAFCLTLWLPMGLSYLGGVWMTGLIQVSFISFIKFLISIFYPYFCVLDGQPICKIWYFCSLAGIICLCMCTWTCVCIYLLNLIIKSFASLTSGWFSVQNFNETWNKLCYMSCCMHRVPIQH